MVVGCIKSFLRRFASFLSTILLLLIGQYCGLTSAQPSYVYHFCSVSTYGPTYQANINLLLSSLSSNQIKRGIGNGYYYNQTMGENDYKDRVYGSVQCRGDVSSELCQNCVDTAAKEIKQSDRCPKSTEAFIWYDECMLRYSNQSFFSIMQEKPPLELWSISLTNPDKFNSKLTGIMDGLIREAVTTSTSYSPSLFAFGDANFTLIDATKHLNSTKIYGMVQCTSDISNNSCNSCLRGAISKLPSGNVGGRAIRPSCLVRYEIYPFMQSKVTKSPHPPPLLNTTPTKSPPASLLNTTPTKAKGKTSTKIVIVIVVPSVIITVLSTIIICYFSLRRKPASKQIDDVDEIQTAESLQFKFSTIRVATDNFSDANKLGQGGFGSVYKGRLSDGKEIAVKRLSKTSGQGEEEFKNEVVLVVKLQHKNLVKLLGFCLDRGEKLLIYEFMLNASLDQFIFDPIKRTYLDWETRYKIIGGIARGLLYLHEDSRLKIIHRDLKASNVLLGADMNPKISDFGMARMFMVDQTQASTNRIVGTYGYMAPEYAIHGQFSAKSDVFSFGILVLEILSGKRSNSFYGSEGVQDLQSYAWQHWMEDTALELLDPTLKEHYSRIEVIRCIHIGLLCVQEDVADRPTMASIVNKLNNYSVTLKQPKSPYSFFGNNRTEHNTPSGEGEIVSINEASMTELLPR